MTLVQKAGFFIENLFKDKLSPAFLYHNYKHTQEVVANAEILANAENLTDDEKEILLVAMLVSRQWLYRRYYAA